ncbi:hypothetical protein NDU88_013276 [Pleurodeles waltl]|uniref:Uncharacterized protein n=1 Tax=Pleurodeles waltl TaxID=8319 RepID=A0AAV7R6A3_PLEWA|nr:hypothetical protein NDU88_013276 [Pleurodeles waltl]
MERRRGDQGHAEGCNEATQTIPEDPRQQRGPQTTASGYKCQRNGTIGGEEEGRRSPGTMGATRHGRGSPAPTIASWWLNKGPQRMRRDWLGWGQGGSEGGLQTPVPGAQSWLREGNRPGRLVAVSVGSPGSGRSPGGWPSRRMSRWEALDPVMEAGCLGGCLGGKP